MSNYNDDYELNLNTVGNQLKENTQRSIEEKTEAIFNYLLELSESASKNSKNNIRVYANDDTIALFKDKRIYAKVAKRFKAEKVNIKLRQVSLLNERAYLTISW